MSDTILMFDPTGDGSLITNKGQRINTDLVHVSWYRKGMERSVIVEFVCAGVMNQFSNMFDYEMAKRTHEHIGPYILICKEKQELGVMIPGSREALPAQVIDFKVSVEKHEVQSFGGQSFFVAGSQTMGATLKLPIYRKGVQD